MLYVLYIYINPKLEHLICSISTSSLTQLKSSKNITASDNKEKCKTFAHYNEDRDNIDSSNLMCIEEYSSLQNFFQYIEYSFKHLNSEFWSVKSPCKNVILSSRCFVLVLFGEDVLLSIPNTSYPFSNN